MEEDNEKKGPIAKSRIGQFEVSVWRQKRTFEARNDFEAEREVVLYRACVQHSRYNRSTHEWGNQRIWCSLDDLRDLRNVLDELPEKMLSGIGSGSEKPRGGAQEETEPDDEAVKNLVRSPAVW